MSKAMDAIKQIYEELKRAAKKQDYFFMQTKQK
jgi:hypothetical protein